MKRICALALLSALLAPVSRADEGWRALALASFDDVWQTIADTFYDPSFGGLDWNAVRAELRPKAEAADSPEAVRRVITEMLARLRRSHFVLLPSASPGDAAPLGNAVVPIDIRLTPAGVVITHVDAGSTAERAGLRLAEIVIAIDGRAVNALMASAQGPDEREKAYDAWRRVFRALHGATGSTATLRVRNRRGAEKDVTVQRGAELGETVTLGNLPPLHVRVDVHDATTPGHRRVGVVGFSVWMPTVDAPVAAAVDRFRHADGLVIDLRGNPGGLATMIRGIAGHLFVDPQVLGRMQTRDTPVPLEFRANPRFSMSDGRRVEPFAGPVAVLVDELTGSASECFAGALQSLGRAHIVGRQTLGAALPASTKRLPNGDVLLYALGDFVTATGRRVEGEGVTPDEVVSLDARGLEALAAGRDPVLEVALRWFDLRLGHAWTLQVPPLALDPPLLLSSNDLHERYFLPR